MTLYRLQKTETTEILRSEPWHYIVQISKMLFQVLSIDTNFVRHFVSVIWKTITFLFLTSRKNEEPIFFFCFWGFWFSWKLQDISVFDGVSHSLLQILAWLNLFETALHDSFRNQRWACRTFLGPALLHRLKWMIFYYSWEQSLTWMLAVC